MAIHKVLDVPSQSEKNREGKSLTLRPWLCGLLLAVALPLPIAPPLDARSPLTMSVSPTMSMAGSTVRVQMRIEPDAKNRALEIVADSADFYRSSLITLDGEGAPRTVFLEYPNLPGGNYVMSGTLSDNEGHVRATVSRDVIVVDTGSE